MTTQHASPPAVVVRLFDLVRDASWLDAHQAGVYTSCAASRIRRACNREDLRHIRVGHARGPILTRSEWIDAWMMRFVQSPAGDVADERDTVHQSPEG
jgi:hypothetical protein